LNVAMNEVFEVLGELVDLRALLADDHADLGRMNLHDDFLAGPLDADLRNARPLELLLDIRADLVILEQQVREVCLAGEPGTCPPGHDPDAEAGRSYLLTHKPLLGAGYSATRPSSTATMMWLKRFLIG